MAFLLGILATVATVGIIRKWPTLTSDPALVQDGFFKRLLDSLPLRLLLRLNQLGLVQIGVHTQRLQFDPRQPLPAFIIRFINSSHIIKSVKQRLS